MTRILRWSALSAALCLACSDATDGPGDPAGPELVPAAAAIGDTVSGETIGSQADVDRFVLQGDAGSQVVVVADALDGAAALLAIRLTDNAGVTLGDELRIPGAAPATLTSGRITVPASGSVHVRVTPDLSSTPIFTGPYRFWSYPVSPVPELHAAAILLSTEVSGERIMPSGDLDEFTFEGTAGEQVSLHLDASHQVLLEIVAPSGGLEAFLGSLGNDTSTAPFALAESGTYRARLTSPGFVSDTGGYTFTVRSLTGVPELAGDTLAIGDTVSTETLQAAPDYDTFVFHGDRRQQINVLLQGLAVAGTGTIVARLSGTRTATDSLMLVGSPVSAAALEDHQALRFELPYTGWYRLTVSGAPGPYRFAVLPVPTDPEVAPAALVIGDSVLGEVLNPLGDMDQYIVTGAPGDELSIIFSSPAPVNEGVFPRLQIFNPETGDSLAIEAAQGMRVAGPVRIPSGGEIAVSVYDEPAEPYLRCSDPRCSGFYRYTGDYAMRLVRISRAPENTTPQFSVGDTVRGEGISPFGDIDEFIAPSLPGTVLRAGIRLTQNPLPAGGGLGGGRIALDVIDPVSRAILLTGTEVFVSTVNFVIYETPFVVGSSGSFLVRIRGSGGYGGDLGTAPYEFLILGGGSGQIAERGNQGVQLRR